MFSSPVMKKLVWKKCENSCSINTFLPSLFSDYLGPVIKFLDFPCLENHIKFLVFPNPLNTIFGQDKKQRDCHNNTFCIRNFGFCCFCDTCNWFLVEHWRNPRLHDFVSVFLWLWWTILWYANQAITQSQLGYKHFPIL